MTNSESRNYTFARPAPRGGLWSLEASAGTGKTWTIENFVADYLSDGVISPEEVVIVTFTRAAAAELRSRIRENIAAIVHGNNSDQPHRNYSDSERDVLRHVLTKYGQIRITTIHGFAQRSLATLGEPLGTMTAEVESESFHESALRDVIRGMTADELAEVEASDDKYFEKVKKVVRIATQHPSGQLFASNPSPEINAILKLATETLEALDARKKYQGLSGYSDLLVRLNARLQNPQDARTLAKSIKVLLIDEFQDTDSLQWEIFKKIQDCKNLDAFVVVGDPKQAIYGFRGGDVQIYREAVSLDTTNFLVGNRRSSTAFINAANEFFESSNFGFTFDSENLPVTAGYVCRPVSIPYHAVEAKGGLSSVTEGPSWLFRKFDGTKAADFTRNATLDLPGYVGALISSDQIPDPATGEMRPIAFNDICVLANSNYLVKRFTDALHDSNIPATVLGGANVFVSKSALQWRMLLEAIARPSRTSSARLLAWTWFGGKSPAEIAENRDNEAWLSELQDKLFRWHELFSGRDRFTFFENIIKDSGVLLFLNEHDGAERNITDVQHIAEIMRLKSSESLEQLIEFLRETSTSADDEISDADVVGGAWSRRVDGDRPAVQVMTIHQSKGLQFPIVIIPYLTDSGTSSDGEIAYRVYKGEEGRTLIDVTSSDGTVGAVIKSKLTKSEHLRKAYVAMTRAQVRNVLGTWSPSKRGSDSVVRGFAWRSSKADEAFNFSWDTTEGTVIEPQKIEENVRTLASVDHSLDAPKQRVSYSALTRSLISTSLAESLPDSEPDGSEGSIAILPEVSKSDYVPLRGSALLGSVVHEVLQNLDFNSENRHQAIIDAIRESAGEYGLALDGPAEDPSSVATSQVVELVERSLNGSLGDIAPGLTLSYFSEERRIPELGFDLNLRSGVTVRDLIGLINKYLSKDPNFASWLDGLDVLDLNIEGFLTGSIDAVLSLDGDSFLVVDYKSNRLSAENSTGYSEELMRRAMSEHHYQLQAIIYLVALHRYLRSRLGSSYSYEQHVAGASYFFLRGMREDVPGAGVITLRPPAECILELSDFFDGVTTDE